MTSRRAGPRPGRRGPGPSTLRRLAWFRYGIRRLLRFSERAARSSGLTPGQHQLLLGVAGFTGRGWATVSEMAEFLQVRHNAAVALIQRAETRGWIRKEAGAEGDRRFVRLRLTAKGDAILRTLARLHLDEIRRIRTDLRALPGVRPRTLSHR